MLLLIHSRRILQTVLYAGALMSAMSLAQAQNNAELAKKLSNPVAALISVPFQLNYDQDIGPDDDGDRYTLNIQPVVPVSISENWNVISRTIVPLISQDDIFPAAGSQSGFGDITQSLFFSPKKPSAGGLIWGVGPVILIPTASDDLLGADQWGLGPTGVVLKQDGPWTYGALANHIWSVSGNDDDADISSTFIQPFLSYTTPTAWTYTLNSESSYDWEAKQWAVPVNGMVSKVTKVGSQLLSIGGGVRYYAQSSDNGPEGFGARLLVTLLFPK